MVNMCMSTGSNVIPRSQGQMTELFTVGRNLKSMTSQQGSSPRHTLTKVATSGLPYALLSVIAALLTPRNGSLATAAFSATLVWLYSTHASRKEPKLDNASRSRASFIGGLLALAFICRRAAGEGPGLWWSQALVPWAVIILRCVKTAGGLVDLETKAEPKFDLNVSCFLVLASALAIWTFNGAFSSLPNAALGICSALLMGTFLAAFPRLLRSESRRHLEKTLVPLDGSFSDLGLRPRAIQASDMRFIAKLSGVLAIASGILSLRFEGPWSSRHLPLYYLLEIFGASVVAGPTLYYLLECVSTAFMIPRMALTEPLKLARTGAFETSLWTLGATLVGNLIHNPSWHAFGLSVVALQALKCSLPEPELSSSRRLSRRSWMTVLSAIALLIIYFVASISAAAPHRAFPLDQALLPSLNNVGGVMQLPNSIHPIKYLVSEAEHRYDDLVNTQSSTLAEAVATYRQRYRIPPPPHFDKWYEFARKRKVQIYDNYDTIHDALQPFWALKPVNIRTRVQEALGFEGNALILLMIRDGRITRLEGGLEWQRAAIQGMLASFVSLLPDLDIAFNGHDEPRIVVPHDELSRIIVQARDGPMNDAFYNDSIVSAFSARPGDMTDGDAPREHKTSRFNEYAHQNTWIPSRLSCPPESPARAVNEDQLDSTATYELGPLGFVFNRTAATDICQIPSLHGTHAFFDRPNAFSVAHDLIPIFSESKISSFQDIPFPSMWHWYGKLFTNRTEDMHLFNVPMYDAGEDMPWDAKSNTLYWRGSTTGAWSQDGGWRRHHRQRMLQQLNAPGTAVVLHDAAPDNSSTRLWRPEEVKRPMLSHLLNVSFTGVGQCEENDCRAQREFFSLSQHVPLSTAWGHKHLLDMDGNAFSARFYALLRSNSLVYKAALFREWHEEWLVPWLHYIPLSITGRDTLEAVRFFAKERDGQRAAARLAERKKEWAARVLRREDMESWMFRCLLEYARVVDDNRSGIGFLG